jgi:hypothetical protein
MMGGSMQCKVYMTVLWIPFYNRTREEEMRDEGLAAAGYKGPGRKGESLAAVIDLAMGRVVEVIVSTYMPRPPQVVEERLVAGEWVSAICCTQGERD